MTTTPAPMTAERAEKIAEEWKYVLASQDDGSSACNLVRELWRERDALTARIAELDGYLATASKNVIEGAEETLKCCAEVERLESELAAARKPPEDEEVAAYVQKLRDFDVGDPDTWIADNWPLEAANLLTHLSAALKETEQERATIRRAALEEAARECLKLGGSQPTIIGEVAAEECARRIRALHQDTAL